ncbi:MAG: glucosidase [Cyclobacteriaceae bacterium]
MTEEQYRLKQCREDIGWKKWGPYLSERQWGTVREDYSRDGNAWGNITHDHSRSKAYRWGEDGIGGFSDDNQLICFSWAFWNEKDPILKERLFGLTGQEGNHGEDVKELYYYLDSTPTHSYMSMLYKYPQGEFPYAKLVDKNKSLGRDKREFELIDTGIFAKDEYFDIFLKYAKANDEDFLIECEVFNRSKKAAKLHALPTVVLRNTWSAGKNSVIPRIQGLGSHKFKITHPELRNYYMHFDGELKETLYTQNDTNRERLYKSKSRSKYVKDAFHEYIVHGKNTVSPKKSGTKASGHYSFEVPAGGVYKIRLRLSKDNLQNPFGQFDEIMGLRQHEANDFYEATIAKNVDDPDLKLIQRQAMAGMMWSKQFYYYNVREWMDGDPRKIPPPPERLDGRNSKWIHLDNHDIISMPDKWEYPWYAAWDLAFHTIPLARVDPDFAKHQLLLLLGDSYQHPNGQIPAYEWNFGDVNPPVHAWAVLRVFRIDRKMNDGKGDIDFLRRAFHRLMINFTWWVNRKDSKGTNIFEGGFLGLDNIGVFDRNWTITEGASIEQADSTGWMAMFSLNMMRMALDLATVEPIYQDLANKYFEHFLYIAGALHNVRNEEVSLWDEDDNFYYDMFRRPDKPGELMKVRSIVGLIPLFAIETLQDEAYKDLPEFRKRLEYFLSERPKLASLVSRWEEPGAGKRHLLSLLRGFRLRKISERMLDPDEFLSDFGIRALSKYHEKYPYEFRVDDQKFSVKYLPGESDSDFFGGNSNWRGPIWFPINFLIIESLYKFSFYYGDKYKLEYPLGSGKFITLKETVNELAKRLINIFQRNEDGERPVFGKNKKFQTDPHFKDFILFYEYFNGDTGEGLGASHQTGWTGLIADVIYKYYNN